MTTTDSTQSHHTLPEACQHDWKSFIPQALDEGNRDLTFHAMFTDYNSAILVHEKCSRPPCGALRWAYYRRSPDGAAFALVDQDTAFGNLYRRLKPREAAGDNH